jgi:hypothetical protein
MARWRCSGRDGRRLAWGYPDGLDAASGGWWRLARWCAHGLDAAPGGRRRLARWRRGAAARFPAARGWRLARRDPGSGACPDDGASARWLSGGWRLAWANGGQPASDGWRRASDGWRRASGGW